MSCSASGVHSFARTLGQSLRPRSIRSCLNSPENRIKGLENARMIASTSSGNSMIPSREDKKTVNFKIDDNRIMAKHRIINKIGKNYGPNGQSDRN
jgi:hypothetical protein